MLKGMWYAKDMDGVDRGGGGGGVRDRPYIFFQTWACLRLTTYILTFDVQLELRGSSVECVVSVDTKVSASLS